MKKHFTANFITETLVSVNLSDSRIREVEIMVDATPIGHTKGWCNVAFLPDCAIITGVYVIPQRITEKAMLNIVNTYLYDKYGLDVFDNELSYYNYFNIFPELENLDF